MIQNAHVAAREPVSDNLSEAARRGLEAQPGLPSGVKYLYAPIDATLDPLQRVKEQPGRSIALDTNITPCAERPGKRLVPTAVLRMERINARFFALHDAPRSYVPRAFKRLDFFCGGRTPAASLKDLAYPVRDERIRCAYGSADYPTLAGCQDLNPGASARLSIPVMPLAAAELLPTPKRKLPLPSRKSTPSPPAAADAPASTGARRLSRNPLSGAPSSGQYQTVSEHASRTRLLYLAHARCGVRKCADLACPHRP
ncbi:MAG: hypothetical protein OXC69_00845 [Candidatus Tectomicrobia bacterium]|nr:hypothetical protein [Candidatus Tectomicrobia bacterium]